MFVRSRRAPRLRERLHHLRQRVRRLRAGGGLSQYTEIQIWAEQVDSTATLDLDCLILIPSTSRVYADGLQIATSGAFTARVMENDAVVAYASSATGADINPTWGAKDLYLPTGDSIIVLAAQRSSSQVTTDTMHVSQSFCPRWRSYKAV